jgi:hypothetical protein
MAWHTWVRAELKVCRILQAVAFVNASFQLVSSLHPNLFTLSEVIMQMKLLPNHLHCCVDDTLVARSTARLQTCTTHRGLVPTMPVFQLLLRIALLVKSLGSVGLRMRATVEWV